MVGRGVGGRGGMGDKVKKEGETCRMITLQNRKYKQER